MENFVFISYKQIFYSFVALFQIEQVTFFVSFQYNNIASVTVNPM